MKKPTFIILLTDYGTRDHYAGTLKEGHPQSRIIDLTHDIEPQNTFTVSIV
ncbi:MAG: hypothetical protein EXS63_01345 [Candidatus Omnitrophica bacterium]|nr:hypothetical protein [Candidatus Omnitrophota bacterium]